MKLYSHKDINHMLCRIIFCQGVRGVFTVLVLFIFAACSTTKNLPEGEQL